jgi:hypothetical protein
VGTRLAAVDALAARTLLKGEALTPPRPRRRFCGRAAIGREAVKGESQWHRHRPMAARRKGAGFTLKSKKHRRQSWNQGHLSTAF